MQQSLKTFRVVLSNRKIIISAKTNQFKVVLVNQTQGTVYQQIYQDANLPISSKYKFSSSLQLFSYVEKYHDSLQYWNTTNNSVSINFQPKNVLTMNLTILDGNTVWPVLFDEIFFIQRSQTQTDSILRQLQGWRQRENQRQNQIGAKFKGMGIELQKLNVQNEQTRELINKMSQRSNVVKQQLYKQLRVQNQKIEQLIAKSLKVEQKNQQNIKQIHFQMDVIQKTQHRNLMTIREQFTIITESIKHEIKLLYQIIEKADLEKRKRDAKMIIQSFDNQIRIKDYVFSPDPKSIEAHEKVYFLNKKTLKCMEDTKDYFKIVGKHAIPYGRFHIRFTVKNIKNNGLLLGVCTSKAKQQLQSITFNDRSCICINSCGYLIHRGAMNSFLGRIKSGDNVRMLVSTSLGQIRWYCNEVQIAGAQLGELRKQQLFPMIGLGNFSDEIELLDRQEKTQQQEINESYAMQMRKLNQKYGKRLVS